MHICFANLQSIAPGQPQDPSHAFLLKVSFPAPATSPFFEENLTCQKTCIDKLLTDSAAHQF